MPRSKRRVIRGRTVMISGAASGIGRALAQRLSRAGSPVAIADIDETGLKETEASLSGPVLARVLDVRDADAQHAFAAEVADWMPQPLGAVFNNAGVAVASSVLDAVPEDDDWLREINFHGVVNGTRAFLPLLVEQDSGVIVNTSSVFGLVGIPDQSAYCASKFAVRGFTESLMVEMVNEPITVHLVHPGGIATNIAKSAGADDFANKFLRTDPAEVATRVAESILKPRARIVLGYSARRTQIGANFLPRTMLNRVLWKQIGPTIDKSDYPA
jgi:NAD(P)-dependent dehydrogenase (short-subunit alcohol dehydrogenase family)